MKVYSPQEIADLLKLKVSTIRKYSIMLEQLGYEFEKNSRNQRYYSDMDIITLRKLVTFKNNGMTLEESADAVMLWHNGNELNQQDITQPQTNTDNATGHYNDDMQALKNMMQNQENMIHKQNELISQLSERLDKQEQRGEKRDQQLMEAINQSLETQKQIATAKEEKSKGFWGRLFKGRGKNNDK